MVPIRQHGPHILASEAMKAKSLLLRLSGPALSANGVACDNRRHHWQVGRAGV